jgi:two-component system sensor histidine kinase HydH
MWPGSLRGRLLILTVVIVALPIVASGYFMMVSAEKALVAEKQQKLFGAARILDEYLVGTYDDILNRLAVPPGDREECITALNRELAAFTDQIAAAYPGIGVGYYSRDLDAIITYGPSNIYADKVGLPIGPTHEGRIVMATGIPRVQEGDLVRGQIMNAMHPIVRDGRVIGYIWANEFTADIQAQIGAMTKQVYITIVLGLIVGILGIFYLVGWLATDIERIKDSLMRLKGDLAHRMPRLSGEMNEIATAINDMADGLSTKRRLEEQVQRAERLALAGELAAGLAHEIRNPMMAVKGFAQLLREEITPAEQNEYTDIIIKETARMNRLIEELLTFARPPAVGIGPVDVNDLVADSLILFEPKAAHSRIEIIRTLAPGLPQVRVDSERLKQVIINVLINAGQAVDHDGEIRVATRYEPGDRTVRISVADTGVGIAPENIGKLFDPFFTTKDTGTGLGLSVADRLMESWGGKILVDSTLGRGSVFTLVLPALEGDSHEQQ